MHLGDYGEDRAGASPTLGIELVVEEELQLIYLQQTLGLNENAPP